jgi:hypothetical protein
MSANERREIKVTDLDLRAQQRFTEAEVQGILNQALGLQPVARDFSWEHVRQMGEELDLAEDVLRDALVDWQRAQEEEKARAAFRAHRRGVWQRHARGFAGTIGPLLLLNLVINLATGSTFWWVIFPLLAMAPGFLFMTWNTFTVPDGASFEQDFQQWRQEQETGQLSGSPTHRRGRGMSRCFRPFM